MGLTISRMCKHIKIISYFFNFTFFNFSEKPKITLRYTVPIYGLSMCKSGMESAEGLPSNRSYKLMNIIGLYKQFHNFVIFEKTKNNLQLHSSDFKVFQCARGELYPLSDYSDIGCTMS